MIKSSFDKAISIGRTPNIQKLFPNSKALIVSGKFLNKSMIKKKAICLAANSRNSLIIRGVLKAAKRANSPIILEIAKSEGGTNGYCSVNFWNIARIVDAFCNELNISVPIILHADHYTIKNSEDIIQAKTEIPTLFEAGITSIAIDASYLEDEKNLLTSINLNKYIPNWSSLETEVGEIKGKFGLSTPDEALFMIKGLNAFNIFPDWIAINNGTTHGINDGQSEIQVGLTHKIHKMISKYGVYGAQHGTSGNDRKKIIEIREKTRTTKANMATALQMVSWGLAVDETGNPKIDEEGNFIKIKGCGIPNTVWEKMNLYAQKKGLTKKEYKKLNLPFETVILSQPKKIRNRIANDVENFTYNILTNIFNSKDSAEIIIEEIVKANTYKPKKDIKQIESKENWTDDRIKERAIKLKKNESKDGDFED